LVPSCKKVIFRGSFLEKLHSLMKKTRNPVLESAGDQRQGMESARKKRKKHG